MDRSEAAVGQPQLGDPLLECGHVGRRGGGGPQQLQLLRSHSHLLQLSLGEAERTSVGCAAQAAALTEAARCGGCGGGGGGGRRWGNNEGGNVLCGELHNGGVLLVHLPHTQSFSFSFLMKGLNKFDYLTNVICKCKYHFFIWSGQTVPVWRPVRGAAVPPCWQ